MLKLFVLNVRYFLTMALKFLEQENNVFDRFKVVM